MNRLGEQDRRGAMYVRASRVGTAMRMASGLMLLALVSLAAPAAGRAATPKEQARVEFEKAQIQYKLGHFDQALEGYGRAYELFHAPAFLFNIGQCHKNLKNYERAIFFFEGYLREEKDPQKRQLAQELADESRAELDKQQKQAARAAAAAGAPSAAAAQGSETKGGTASHGAPRAETVPPRAPEPRTVQPLVAAQDAPAVGGPPAADAAPAPKSGSSWWLWAGIGVAAAVLAGGVAYWATGSGTTVPPGGTVGTLDRRMGEP